MVLNKKDEEKLLDYLKQNCTGFDLYDIEELTEEWLADVYGEVSVCGIKYDAASLLREHDPAAFRAAVLDYIEAEELDELGDGKFYYKRDIESAMSELGID